MALAFVLLQLLAAFWASVACASIAYYGVRLHRRDSAKKDDDGDGDASTLAPPLSACRLLFAALPATLLLVASPSLFVNRHQAQILVTPVLGQLSLTSFKLLAFALGRGLLVAPAQNAQLLEFIAFAVAPILPPTRAELRALPSETANNEPTDAEARALLLAAIPQALTAAFAGFVAGSADTWGLPLPIKHWFYTLLLAECVSCVWQLWRAGAASLPAPPFPRRLRSGKQFDAPWLSDGLAEYWGRRWNATTARTLRPLVFDPIIEGRLVAGGGGGGGGDGAAAAAAPPAGAEGPVQGRRATAATVSPLRRYLALQATFLLSGLWHALVLYRPNTGTWQGAWRWALFFSVQAPLMVGEALLSNFWRRKLKMPPLPQPLRVVLTNALLIAVAMPLFFGPCDWTGMCGRMFEEARGAVAWGGGALGRSWRWAAQEKRVSGVFVAEPGF